LISICRDNGKPFEKYEIELSNVQQTIPEQKRKTIKDESTPPKARPTGAQQSNLIQEAERDKSNNSNLIVTYSTSTRKAIESPIEDTDDKSDEDVTILLP
jgi:hypothetical protein